VIVTPLPTPLRTDTAPPHSLRGETHPLTVTPSNEREEEEEVEEKREGEVEEEVMPEKDEEEMETSPWVAVRERNDPPFTFTLPK
jgi:hypothetical protein